MPGKPDANIALMRSAFEALNRRDLDACVALMTPDFAIAIAGMPADQRGTAAWRRNAETLFRAFPDATVAIDDIFADDDMVCVRLTMSGTHTGPFLGLPPTGNPIRYESTEVYRIADGRIAAEWICSDMLTLMSQIGGYPARHLLGLWISSYKVWIAAAAGLALGAALGFAL